MKFSSITEQATAEFKKRRRLWRKFASVSIETLELIEQHPGLPFAERKALMEHLRQRKREAQAQLKVAEKRAEFWERAALPIAATFFSVLAWLSAEAGLTGSLKVGVTVAAFTAAVAMWAWIRYICWKRLEASLRGQTTLGKVE